MSDRNSTPSPPGSPIAPLPDFTPSRPYRFTWDASRRPGPASVSATSEGRGGDYITSNARPDLFNLSSATLALGALPQEWSSTKQGFNAISTVLNNPHKRSDPPKAHATVPPVPPSELPRVRRKDFESYLKAISPEWEQFERNSEMGHQGFAQIDEYSAGDAQFYPDAPASPSIPRSPRPPPGKSLVPLETLPSVFFDPKFDLGNPRTFALVTEQQEGNDGSSDPASLSHSLPLLEKLSHYADTIELHLIREISRRSSSFFAALTNLNDLQTESEQCLDRIQQLRGMLKDVDETSAKRGLEVVRMEKKLHNVGVVQESVKMVSGVGEMLGVARGLVSAGEWGEALGIVEGIERLWESQTVPAPSKPQLKKPPSASSTNGRRSSLPSVPESPPEERRAVALSRPSIPLSSLQAFASLPEHLRVLTLEISTSLASELDYVLKTDLLRRMDKGSAMTGDTAQEAHQVFKDRLRPLLFSLKRTRGVREFVLKWRDLAIGDIRGAAKRHLPFSEDFNDNDSPSGEKPGVERSGSVRLWDFLRSMSHSDYMTLTRSMYSTLLNGIQGLQVQTTTFVDVLESIQSLDSAVDITSLQADLSDIISSATETAHIRASKVIGIRSEQHASLDLPSFLDVFSETWDFVIKTEVICRRMIVGLRGVIVSQAKLFLQTSHAARISQSSKLVEDEQWAATEVMPHYQTMASILVDAAVRDPPELVLTGRTPAAITAPNAPDVLSPESKKAVNGKPTGAKHLHVEDRAYFAVAATLQTVLLLSDYLKIIINLSLLTTEAVSRVIEFLKAFNSRTCQVVLGAGAMRSAGLKNITAKHLALASQSLSIFIALIPYVRESFRRHLNPKQAVMLVEFDKLKRDYQDHQDEIHAKLIAIMGDRLIAHCKTLQTVNWDVPREGVNEYMELLVKETVTLHKVLSRYLPDTVVEFVMSQVFADINHRLSEEYGNIELPNQDAKDRLLKDARFLHQKLSALKNVGAPTGMLETVILEKSVPRKMGSTGPESANERIKGMFTRNTSTGSKDSVITSPSLAFSASPEKEKDQGAWLAANSPGIATDDRLPSGPAPLPAMAQRSGGLTSSASTPVGASGRGPVREKELPNPTPDREDADSTITIIEQASTAAPTPTPKPADGDANGEGGGRRNELPNGDSVH